MTDKIKQKARELAIAYFKDTNEQGVEYYDTRCEAACQEMAKWIFEEFEKNRLAACDRQTKAEADIEMDFVMGVLKEHRQPTFDDAIKYGKKKMIDKACKWWFKNDSYSKPIDMLIRDFRKAMEEIR